VITPITCGSARPCASRRSRSPLAARTAPRAWLQTLQFADNPQTFPVLSRIGNGFPGRLGPVPEYFVVPGVGVPIRQAGLERDVTAARVARRAGYPHLGYGVAVLLLAGLTAACGRQNASAAEPRPTYIPQPTPDATMVEVIRGNASPVVYLPPLEIRGSPTAAPTAGRAAPAPTRAAPKPSNPARESAPAPVRKPSASNPAPRPAPTAVRPSAPTPAPPAIINPNPILPSGAGRPNATPSR
jgi:hypothetical protein